MDQFRIEKDHNFAGQNIQGVDLLQDDEAFENFFFASGSMDYNLSDTNLSIYFNELQELLNEGNSGESVKGEVHGSNSVPVQMNNEVAMETKLKEDEGQTKDYVRRKRYKKGSVEYAQMLELRKIKSRETTARYLEKKKAYVEQLELTVKDFSKKNAHLKKVLQFGRSSLSSGRPQIQLRRTTSASL